MARAPLFGNFGRDPFTIVADFHLHQPLPKGDFRFDMGCTSMRESIPQRLASNSVHFVSNKRLHHSQRAFHNETKGRPAFGCEFVTQRSYGLS